jgi:hypothetical protein
MTTETHKKPSPEEIDTLCLAVDTAAADAELANSKLSAAKATLLVIVREFGYVPTRAEKTKRLEGILYVADSTVGSKIEIDEEAVAELQLELSRAKKPSVFGELFETNTKHTLRKSAGDVLKLALANLVDKKQAALLGIFARCFRNDSKAPSITVDLLEVVKAKEAKAEATAAKKAAKAVKKGSAK